MMQAVCKDCLREERAAQLGLSVEALAEDFDKEFAYNERAMQVKLKRGETRSDRCKRHRARHRVNIQGMAVPFIDLQTIGEAIGAHDENGPTGPFGGLGPMPEAHKIAVADPVDLGKFGFGMNEDDVRQILQYLADPDTRICVVKAGTGTGKSTYMPYRLLDPPGDAAVRLADLGPIIVTEPRVQATTGVAGFVGSVMSGAGGVGPGYPVGFQVSGNRAHDDSCQLIYVTDGTMINWLREGRLSTIGTVIVDEAHERSTNIDFIMGYLKKAVDRYPHLRVIITSATFDERFYQEYFGGKGKVEIVDVPAVKSIGYGFPLFPDLDAAVLGGESVAEAWSDVFKKELPLRQIDNPADREFVTRHFQELAPPLKASEVAKGHEADIGWPEDLHDTTEKLVPLRFQGFVPEHQWKDKMPQVLGEYIVKLVKGLDQTGVFGDILGFLPTGKSIEEAVTIIKDGLGIRDEPDDPATVYALLSSLEGEKKVKALAAQGKGDKRKIVISTNLAETSLTVEGVRFVVDSGLIAQEQWDPAVAQGGIPTIAHSQAGVRQRWGRVGRKAPGWVFPLYTKAQFLALRQDTPPGSARSNLEQLIMTAKLGGIDDVVNFDWPAKFVPDEESGVKLDQSALEAREIFLAELQRADAALKSSGAIDPEHGDPTPFGKELSRSPGLGTTASAIAIMHADRLACVPEVVTILKLLENTSLVGPKGLLLDGADWPDEWRLEAAERHRALATACQDDAELVLQVMAVWERTAPGVPPWEPSAERERWARRWWINHDALTGCAEARREVLSGLSPAMKEEVKRFVEPALVRRARGAITRAMASLEYRLEGEGVYRAVAGDDDTAPTGVLGNAGMVPHAPSRMIPLKRTKLESREHAFLSNIVTVEEWALPPRITEGEAVTSTASAMDLLVRASREARPEPKRDTLSQLQNVWPAGMRVQLAFERRGADVYIAGPPARPINPAPQPAAAVAESDDADEVPEDEAPDSEATPEDASPELDTSWPAPVAMEPDLEMAAEHEVIDVEEHESALLACQACEQCRLGNLDACLDPLEPVAPEHAVDELASWRERASRYLKVEAPRVEFEAGGPENGGWYEVTGYDVESSAPTIKLRPDWRPPGIKWVPGVHRGIEPGRVLEVEVGPMVSDHRGDLRIFHRTDGGGRFVLREAHRKSDQQEKNHQLALSLSRSTAGLLERLQLGTRLLGHAIPRRQPGCMTITFLGLLRGHWDSNVNQPEELATTRGDGTPGTARFYRGITVEPPNDAGWATAVSAIRDPERGVEHLFGIRVFDPRDESSAAEATPLRSGEPLILQVRWETARLAVGGLPAAQLQEVLEAYPDAFHPVGPLRDRASGSGDSKADAPEDLAQLETVPNGWYLPAKRAVSVRAARRLSDLKPTSREWVSDCWYFWARSRHLQTSTNDGFRLAADGSRIDIPADTAVLPAQETGDAPPVTVSCAAPPHWANLVRFKGDDIASLFGASSVAVDGREVIAAFGDVAAADAAQPVMARVLSSPAALIEYPQGSRNSRDRGDHALEPMAVQGMYVANHDWKNCRVTVVGDISVFARCIDEMARRLGLTTGWMRVPDPRNNGSLIGERGAQVNALKASSGCTSAQHHGRGTVDWDLAGPAPANIHAFIQLAQEVVPGVVGGVTETVAATVTDLDGRQQVEDSRTHPWTSVAVRSPRIEVRNPAHEDDSAPDIDDVGTPDLEDDPASTTDAVLRSVVSAVRDGRGASVDPARMSDLPLDCVLSFLAGLASSQPGTRLRDRGTAGFEIIPPGSSRGPRRTPTGGVRRYSLDHADTALHAPTTMLLIGDAVVIDTSTASPEEAARITYYFAGLSAGLGVPYRSSAAHLLTVG
jgi:HrpA-like RNA helicase